MTLKEIQYNNDKKNTLLNKNKKQSVIVLLAYIKHLQENCVLWLSNIYL